ncbi:MAG: hypothetical protein QM703_22760 [Gemmatales bacterium]
MIESFLDSTFAVVRQTKSKNSDGSETVSESYTYSDIPASIQWKSDDRVWWHRQEQVRLTAVIYTETQLTLIAGDLIEIEGTRHKFMGSFTPVNSKQYWKLQLVEKVE